jgi:hypothetical protein
MAALEESLAAVRSDDEKPAAAKKASTAKGDKAPARKRTKAKA